MPHTLAAVTTDSATVATWQSHARCELRRLLLGHSGAAQPLHSDDADLLSEEVTDNGTTLVQLGFTSTAGPGATGQKFDYKHTSFVSGVA
jgi:hypothetical protein